MTETKGITVTSNDRELVLTAVHWSAEDRKSHEEMGFHEGWGKCADQLAELAARI